MKRRGIKGRRSLMALGLGVASAAACWLGCAGGMPAADVTAHEAVPMSEETGALAPIRLDRDKLAGIDLQKWPDMSPEEVLEGGAGHRGHIFFSGDEIVVELWEADAGKLRLDDFPYEEFVLVLSGKLVLTDANGNSTTYSAGESLVVPKGFKGTWEMLGNYRELVVIEKEAYVREEGE